MKQCSRCGLEKNASEFGEFWDGRKIRVRSRCRACLADYHRENRGRFNKKRVANRQKSRGVQPRVIDLMDAYPDRCMHRMGTSTPCLAKATWRNGEWRACDKHKLPGDRSLSEFAP